LRIIESKINNIFCKIKFDSKNINNNKLPTTEEIQNYLIKTENIRDEYENCLNKASEVMEKFLFEISYEEYSYSFKNLLNQKKLYEKYNNYITKEFNNRFDTMVYFAQVLNFKLILMQILIIF